MIFKLHEAIMQCKLSIVDENDWLSRWHQSSNTTLNEFRSEFIEMVIFRKQFGSK